jgi:hypothetical protein
MACLSPEMYVYFIRDMEKRERHSHISVNMNSIALLVYNMVAGDNCLEIRSVGKPV